MAIYMWRPEPNFATQWPCPDGFHVPLKSEFDDIISAWVSLWAWTSSWWNNMKTYLKLPFAGNRNYGTSETGSVGSGGIYWTALPGWADVAHYLDIYDGGIYSTYDIRKTFGASIRPFKNSSVTPTSSRTKLYWTSIQSWGIFRDSSEWFISISSNWSTWITIADKNVWATTVYNSGDTLSESNCGKFYQRWNNYGFPRTWSVSTSSTRVNAWDYWPWNYYSSSTFIIRTSSPRWWDSSNNANLRWWDDGNVPVS